MGIGAADNTMQFKEQYIIITRRRINEEIELNLEFETSLLYFTV
jgi:hypothetical protein